MAHDRRGKKASVQKRAWARLRLSHLPGGYKKSRNIWVDGSDNGRLVDWIAARFQVPLDSSAASQTNKAVRTVTPPLDGRTHLRNFQTAS
jgi:hypothetical protein